MKRRKLMADGGIINLSPAVYFNGRIMPAADARVSIADHGVLFGCGFFETFRTSGGRPHHWRFHRARLAQACRTAGLILPPSFLAADETRLGQVVTQLLRESGCADAVFRYTVTAGVSGEPTEFLTMRSFPVAPAAGGIRLRVLQLRRDSGEWIPRPKSLNYANAMLGAQELAGRTTEPTDEGLFLARDGEWVVETARQAIAWVVKGCIRYPDPSVGGVSSTSLAWLQTLDLVAEPTRASLPDLLIADGIVMLNAVRGIVPVAEVWNETDTTLLRRFDSADHPLIVGLQQQWQDALTQMARG